MCLGAQCLALEAGGSEGGCTDLPWGLAPVPHDHPPVNVPSVHSPDNLSVMVQLSFPAQDIFAFYPSSEHIRNLGNAFSVSLQKKTPLTF